MKKQLLLLLILPGYWAAGQTRDTEKSIKEKACRRAIAQAERFVDSLRTKQAIPGLSVCVGTSEKILWAEGFGLADLEAQLPVTVSSRFRMGSVSKSITSLAVGKLVEEGKLNLDAPVAQYVPGFPVKKYPFTARQLATHTAGIRHYRNTDPLACPKRYASVQEGLTIFSQDSLLFQPGTAFQYSTYGYTLLSAVIEAASQTDYVSYLQQAVFLPLGMKNTGADYRDSLIANRVRFYEYQNKKWVHAAPVDNSYKWAGGGLLSTPVDLVRMAGGLLRNQLLRQETVALLFTPQRLPDGKNTQYGFGWRIGTGWQGRKIIHHGGLIDGGRTFLLLYPEDDLIVAIAANRSTGGINQPEAEAIARYFFPAKR
ncbi:serine hydrolase domain-containing protein [Larkinella ripae]